MNGGDNGGVHYVMVMDPDVYLVQTVPFVRLTRGGVLHFGGFTNSVKRRILEG